MPLTSKPEMMHEARAWLDAILRDHAASNREVLYAAIALDALDVAIEDADQPEGWERPIAPRKGIRFEHRDAVMLLRLAARRTKAKINETVRVDLRLERTDVTQFGATIVGVAQVTEGRDRESVMAGVVRQEAADALTDAVNEGFRASPDPEAAAAEVKRRQEAAGG